MFDCHCEAFASGSKQRRQKFSATLKCIENRLASPEPGS